jgi:hypothetical protein
LTHLPQPGVLPKAPPGVAQCTPGVPRHFPGYPFPFARRPPTPPERAFIVSEFGRGGLLEGSRGHLGGTVYTTTLSLYCVLGTILGVM